MYLFPQKEKENRKQIRNSGLSAGELSEGEQMSAVYFEMCSKARQLRDGALTGTGERSGHRVVVHAGPWAWAV